MRYILIFITISSWLAFMTTGCDNKSILQSKQRIYTNSLKSPELVVEAFCALDAAGKRLSGPMTDEEYSYVTWLDEPGWDTIILVANYKVGNIKHLNNTTEVTVEYQVVGKYSHDLQLIEKKEIVVFKVIKTDSGWKITSPDFLTPHVNPNILVNLLEDRIKAESDTAKLKKLQADIVAIKQLSLMSQDNGKK